MQEIFKEKLQHLMNDDLLVASIKTLFDERIEKERPLVKDEGNQILGEKYRAYLEARKIIENVFNDLNNYKVNKINKPEINRAL